VNILMLLAIAYGLHYLSLAFTAGWLAWLYDAPSQWSAWIPGWNVLYLYELVGRPRSDGVLALVFLLVFPVLGAFFLTGLGGAMAADTGRPRWLGYLLTIPLIALIGLPCLAITTRAGARVVDGQS